MLKIGLLCLLALSLGAEAAPAVSAADEVLIASPKGDIMKSDFEAELSSIPESDRVDFVLDQKRIDKTLDAMLINRWLAAEAREMGLDRDPVLMKRIALDTEKTLARARVEKLEKAAVLPDADKRVREYYLANKDQYVIPLTLRASHILVDFKNRSKEEALARAQELRRQALSGEKSFEELALENSDDPSAKSNKGDLGYFSEGRMIKPFWEAASALKTPGEISEPVETQFGYHIIRLAERKERRERSFEEMKDSILAELQADYVKKVSADYANQIRANEKVKADKEAILRLNPRNDPNFPKPQKK
ncbi:MAG: peptidylprolyl isomerase [Sulfuricella sp.]|nr:peptidylprolyl isomerase [Sulfuricella sp.]